MNWIITGGCGFIGRNLIRRLRKEESNNILVIDNLSVGSREDLSECGEFTEIEEIAGDFWQNNLQLLVADVTDQKKMNKAFDGADFVIHLAANTGVAPSVEDPAADLQANVLGVFSVLELSRKHGIKRFVFASSGAPLGEVTPPIHEKLAPKPVSPYGASKLAGEAYCSAYWGSYGVETVVLRFGNVYGPGSKKKNSVIAKFIKKALEAESVEVFGDGEQTRDFIYVEDLARAIQLAALREGVAGEIFQIATNEETTVNSLIALLNNLLKEANRPAVNYNRTIARTGDVKRNYSDISKAKNVLKWAPEFDLKTGLRKTLNYFEK